MASFVTVRNVNPIGAVAAYIDDEHVEVPAGGTIDVTPEAAGKAPRWRRAEVDEQGHPVDRIDQMHTRHRAGHIEVYDLGHGLLAQPSAWRLAGDDTEPADPTDDGGGQLIDVQATGGQLLVSPVGETGPEEFSPEASGVVTPNTGTENS